MRLVLLIYVMLVSLAAQALSSSRADWKEVYNEKILDPANAVTEFISIVFPDVYGLENRLYQSPFKMIAGYRGADVVVLPDLPDGMTTRAFTMGYLQRTFVPRDAVLFVHDDIDRKARVIETPQSFVCNEVLFRAPSYIDAAKFKRAFLKQSLPVLPKMRLWDSNDCYRLNLGTPSPSAIQIQIQKAVSDNKGSGRYFVIMDQRQMPGQKDAQYSAEDWDAAFGKDGYMMLIDLYAKTAHD